ncbi:ABC transporter permease [Nocardioides kribbensis]|uniref:ABC transporter permease n=1 Tax=Nocardioides kribbensis TaxID=305517 RepID=UPI00187908D4|nr:ABC transporter permease [Nocardioides kribbensis]
MSTTTPRTEPTAPAAPATDAAGGSGRGAGVRRVRGLARANATLMTRNRLTLLYAVVLPVLPLVLLLTGPRGDVAVGAATVVTALMMTLLFPVYYNLLSQFVTRRDELVLKRLRTGETRDAEILVALALPGLVVAVTVSLVTVVVALALGAPAPVNPVLYAGAVLLGALMSVALAYWTAAWTRNAEAAQMTSLPVILLLVVGQVAVGFPDSVQRWTDWTPGAALTALVRIGWFGLDDGSTTPSLDLADTWSVGLQPVLVLVLWTAVGLDLARRSLRWEPQR